MEGFDVCVNAIPDNSSLALDVEGTEVLLCNAAGTHYALENRCTHQDTPLTKGRIRNGFISCPLHGVRFELATGEPRGALTKVAIPTFEVAEQDGKVWIKLNKA